MGKIFETGDRQMDFILTNYSKVRDLEECLNYTKLNFHISLLKKLKFLLEDWGYKYPIVVKKYGEDYLFWGDSEYYHNGVGLYYAVEIGTGWDTLAGVDDNRIIVKLDAEIDDNQQENDQKLNDWISAARQHVRANQCELIKKGIRVEGNAVAEMDLTEELCLKNLSISPFEEIAITLKNKIGLFVESLTGKEGLIGPFFK